jgi:hypothetical protein
MNGEAQREILCCSVYIVPEILSFPGLSGISSHESTILWLRILNLESFSMVNRSYMGRNL